MDSDTIEFIIYLWPKSSVTSQYAASYVGFEIQSRTGKIF